MENEGSGPSRAEAVGHLAGTAVLGTITSAALAFPVVGAAIVAGAGAFVVVAATAAVLDHLEEKRK